VEASRHDLARAQTRLEDEIASLNERATNHDKVLYGGTIGNPRELQALQDEIGSLKRRISHLEDQELELMEQMEPLDADLARLAAERAGIDDRAAALRAEIAEQEVAIDAELEGVRSERAALVAEVDADLLTTYDELRPRSGGIAIARLVGTSCGGCHLTLSAVEIDRIKKLPPDEPVHCEECGRLLAR
jgi:predicted  nucleic acid-binding Zn-ribbon protein